MPLMDEFREEREAIKHGTPKQKYQYFKDYYRTPTIIAVLSAIFIGILVYQFVTKKDLMFYAVMLNCAPYDENEWFLEEYASRAEIDLDSYDVTLDTGAFFKLNASAADEDSYITRQKLETYAGAGKLDVMVGAGDEFAYFANSILFKDLREVLTAEQLERYEPYLYYVDRALMDAAAGVNETDAVEIPDPKAPEAMKRPVPVAIYVENSEALQRAYYFRNAEAGIAVGVYANTSHPDNALAFIDFLLSEE